MDEVRANVFFIVFRDIIRRSLRFCISSRHPLIHYGVCSISSILPGVMQIGLQKKTMTHASRLRTKPQIHRQIHRPAPPLPDLWLVEEKSRPGWPAAKISRAKSKNFGEMGLQS